MPVTTCIDDLKKVYARRVPRMFYDYTESGSWSEQTFKENVNDFQRLYFRQRVAVDIEQRNTQTHMVGQSVNMPVALAPVGLTGMQAADGEIKAAQAAEEFGVPFTLSTMSICSIEDVAARTQKPFWFQLYVMRDQEFLENIIQRAKDAQCSALVLTVDLQILGQRHKDLKNGLSAPPKLTLPTLANLATKWSWGMSMLKTPRRQFGNIVGHARGVKDTRSLMSWTAQQFDPKLDWNKVSRIRDMWDGAFIIKGILDPDDARCAVDHGADAVIVSNHGGRQLDGALSSIRALPEIVNAVGQQTEVHFDGGIRSGQDVLKALALGAKGTYIGRAFVYGLGAYGKAGVCNALTIIKKEMSVTMALCGVTEIEKIDKSILRISPDFVPKWI